MVVASLTGEFEGSQSCITSGPSYTFKGNNEECLAGAKLF